jgi:alpha-tubulin suppressor-like RCC1 family protein
LLTAVGLFSWTNLHAQSQIMLQSWGWNSAGQLGNNTQFDSNEPLPVQNLEEVISVAAGFAHSASLRQDGTVWTWGGNAYGQLGNGNNNDQLLASPVVGPEGSGTLSSVRTLASGYNHNLVVRNDGTVWAWGRNNSGQLGNGANGTSPSFENANTTVPVQVRNASGSGFLTGIVAVAGGGFHSLALGEDGTVWAWGSNSRGQLGINSTDALRNRPVQVSNLTDVIAIAAGEAFSLALKRDGTLWAWGDNAFGQLGNNTFSRRLIPAQVVKVGFHPQSNPGFLTGVTAIAAGSTHSLAILQDGSVVVWGANTYGQLGDENLSSKPIPQAVPGLSNIMQVAGGFGHSMAIRGDGTLLTWGFNFYGQLGDGSNWDRVLPAPVDALAGSGSGACGYWHTVALAPGRSVSGTITPEGAYALAQPLTITFRPQGAPEFTRNVTLNSEGGFTVENLPRTTYTLHVKGRKWLATNISVDTRFSDVVNADATLLAGDLNDDNQIDLFDLIEFFGSYGSVMQDPNWNERADLFEDSIVDLFDLILFFTNYGAQGDP